MTDLDYFTFQRSLYEHDYSIRWVGGGWDRIVVVRHGELASAHDRSNWVTSWPDTVHHDEILAWLEGEGKSA